MIAFTIIMLGFALMGYIAFGSDVHAFRTFGKGIANLVQFLISDMNMDALMKSNKYIGNIYYIMWSILMIVVLSNVFIAILCTAYSEVQEEMKRDNPSIEIPGLGVFTRFSSKIQRKLSFSQINKNEDNVVDESELKSVFGEDAAEVIIKRYGGEDGVIDKNEFERLKTDIMADEEADDE